MKKRLFGTFFIRPYDKSGYSQPTMAHYPEPCVTSQPCTAIVAEFGKGNTMKAIRKILAVAGAAALVTIAGPAWAAGSYTITAGTTSGGDVAYTGSTSQIDFYTEFVQMGCTSGTADGQLHTGSNATGANIASIDSSTWNNCVGPAGLSMVVTQNSSWTLNAVGTPSGGVTAGTITDVDASIVAINPDTGQPDPALCSFDATGSTDGFFQESDQTLHVTTPTTGQKLTVGNTVGCFGQVLDGDEAFFEGAYALANPAGPIVIAQP